MRAPPVTGRTLSVRLRGFFSVGLRTRLLVVMRACLPVRVGAFLMRVRACLPVMVGAFSVRV